MIFKEGSSWIGVAMEFNIVVTGDDPRVVEAELQEAVLGYLESARKLKKGFREQQVNTILNQETSKEYEDRWIAAYNQNGDTPSPISDFYKFGVSNLANV